MEDIPISMDSGVLLQQLGEYGYIHDRGPDIKFGNYRIASVHRLDYDTREDGGQEFHGFELRNTVRSTGQFRQYAYYAWFIPDQQMKFSHENRHELVDDEGKKLKIALYIDNHLLRPVNGMLFSYVHGRRNEPCLDNRNYAEMEAEMIERCAVKS